MELAIATPQGSSGTVEVSESAFGKEFNQDLVHQAVVAFLAGARQGTRAQKKPLRSVRRRQEALPSEGDWPRTCRHHSQPFMALGRDNICSPAARSQPQVKS